MSSAALQATSVSIVANAGINRPDRAWIEDDPKVGLKRAAFGCDAMLIR
jgi:hypothetical protein